MTADEKDRLVQSADGSNARACEHGGSYREGDHRVCVECGARFPEDRQEQSDSEPRRCEYAVICADGSIARDALTNEREAVYLRTFYDENRRCGPHRIVQRLAQRTVTEWEAVPDGY